MYHEQSRISCEHPPDDTSLILAQVQRKAQRQASRCNTAVFTPQFRQQRHTHLDLNQFFSPNIALPIHGSSSLARSLSDESWPGETRSSSSSNVPLLLLPPSAFRACLPHRNLAAAVEVPVCVWVRACTRARRPRYCRP